MCKLFTETREMLVKLTDELIDQSGPIPQTFYLQLVLFLPVDMCFT